MVFQHMMDVYSPTRLRLVFVTRPRGGISSKIVVDSDWKVRGGREDFRDWVGQDDTVVVSGHAERLDVPAQARGCARRTERLLLDRKELGASPPDRCHPVALRSTVGRLPLG